MRMSDIFYADPENTKRLKNALAILSIDLRWPGDPQFPWQDSTAVANCQQYIALEYHLALCYLRQNDLSLAITYAEFAKDDFVKLFGVGSKDQNMLPFYVLLMEVYSADISTPYVKLSRRTFADHQQVAEFYENLIDEIYMLAPMSPTLPNINSLLDLVPRNYNVANTLEDRMNMLQRQIYKEKLMNLHCKLVSRHGFRSGYEDEYQRAFLYATYSELLLAQPDLLDALIFAKKAETTLRQALNFTSHPDLQKIYNTLHLIYTKLAFISCGVRATNLFASTALDYAALLTTDATPPPITAQTPPTKRRRSNALVL